jgi:uncharacterized membrane protein YuzA (DUF378 family)
MAGNMEKTAKVVAGVGALNWGIVTFAGMNIVDKLLGFLTFIPATIPAAKIVYGIVAAAGAYVIMQELNK